MRLFASAAMHSHTTDWAHLDRLAPPLGTVLSSVFDDLDDESSSADEMHPDARELLHDVDEQPTVRKLFHFYLCYSLFIQEPIFLVTKFSILIDLIL